MACNDVSVACLIGALKRIWLSFLLLIFCLRWRSIGANLFWQNSSVAFDLANLIFWRRTANQEFRLPRRRWRCWTRASRCPSRCRRSFFCSRSNVSSCFSQADDNVVFFLLPSKVFLLCTRRNHVGLCLRLPETETGFCKKNPVWD